MALRGEAHPRAKLKDTDVGLIHRLAAEGVPRTKIAARLGVSVVTIRRVLRGDTRALLAPSPTVSDVTARTFSELRTPFAFLDSEPSADVDGDSQQPDGSAITDLE